MCFTLLSFLWLYALSLTRSLMFSSLQEPLSTLSKQEEAKAKLSINERGQCSRPGCENPATAAQCPKCHDGGLTPTYYCTQVERHEVGKGDRVWMRRESERARERTTVSTLRE